MLWGIDYHLIIIGAYVLLTGALLWAVNRKGSSPMLRTILTIAAVCAIGLGYSFGIKNDWTYSALMIGVDAVACLIITWHPAGKVQGVIGLSYLLQIGVHIGRLVSEIVQVNPDTTVYWWALTALAFLQIALVGGWYYGERRGFTGWGLPDPLPSPSRGKSAEG